MPSSTGPNCLVYCSDTNSASYCKLTTIIKKQMSAIGSPFCMQTNLQAVLLVIVTLCRISSIITMASLHSLTVASFINQYINSI